MKGIKGRFLRKLKSIRPIAPLKQSRVLRVNVSDEFLDPNVMLESSSVCKDQNQKNSFSNRPVQEPEIIDVSELMRDLEDEDMESDDEVGNKENIGPSVKLKDPSPSKDESESEESILSESEIHNPRSGPLSELDASSVRRHDQTVPFKDNSESPPQLPEPGICNPSDHPLSEIDIPSFRRPDLNSGSLFDPNLLEAFKEAVMNHIRIFEAERKARRNEGETVEKEEVGIPSKDPEMEGNPLLEFEEKCPPGGSESVVLYTTSLRGIRKTFEDCNSIRFLLGSFRIVYHERDVSMHLEFREELWRILGGKVVPPRLFIKGRYIGGAEVVEGLHEQGKLRQLLQGIPLDKSEGPCEGCAGYRFVLCFSCNGSHRKTVSDEENNEIQCPECNENGLIICPICC